MGICWLNTYLGLHCKHGHISPSPPDRTWLRCSFNLFIVLPFCQVGFLCESLHFVLCLEFLFPSGFLLEYKNTQLPAYSIKRKTNHGGKNNSRLIDLIQGYFYLTWFAFSPSNLREKLFAYRNDISKNYSTHVACYSVEFWFSNLLFMVEVLYFYHLGILFPVITVASDPSVPL